MRLQFSLRAILVWVTLLGAWLALEFTKRTVVHFYVEMALVVAWPAVLITIIVYGKKHVRAFAIGGLLPSALALGKMIYWMPALIQVDWGEISRMLYEVQNFPSAMPTSIIWLPTSVLLGVVCVGIWKVLDKSD
jgi:hypothetical protein